MNFWTRKKRNKKKLDFFLIGLIRLNKQERLLFFNGPPGAMDNAFAYENRRFQYGTGVERQYGKLDHEYEGSNYPLEYV